MTTPDILAPLLQRCAQRDEKALAELYQLTSPKLFGVALRILRRNDWAEEVLQECYVNIWQHAGSYSSDKSAPQTWITRIVRNRCLDWLRRPDHEVADVDDSIVENWADDAPGPLARLLASDDSRRIAGCMQGLEASHRQAIALAYFDGLSHSELAEKLTLPLGTVKSWIRRGLEKLRLCLG
ncbi:RNA polymerase sigma-70 factor, ECF subfamily [Andreprevotia lacus DSM 23236]|jgi:RNA polymerase sigma-70 factor (ECF subfamily)|uniref:RNA polymerase sigma-70 factor, ECF subfamily n=1 Tax=Andreprevotia lacus DSM 23236 TaxID=1121001 RepID=A0A1W1Y0V9_9NEIS|nr:RNA polymerase sigma-70 factor, ECF subfamily [Andreprevotia lacus DSM 23236]